jgi:2Fe-2S ferredoxin
LVEQRIENPRVGGSNPSLATIHFSFVLIHMPKLTLINDGSVHEFEIGAVPYGGHGKPGSILDLAMHFNLPLNHVCGGNCSCTTCHVIIEDGASNLGAMSQDEEDFVGMLDGGTDTSRLGCQTIVQGDVSIRIPE